MPSSTDEQLLACHKLMFIVVHRPVLWHLVALNLNCLKAGTSAKMTVKHNLLDVNLPEFTASVKGSCITN